MVGGSPEGEPVSPDADEPDDERDGSAAERRRLIKGAALGAILGLVLAGLARLGRRGRAEES